MNQALIFLLLFLPAFGPDGAHGTLAGLLLSAGPEGSAAAAGSSFHLATLFPEHSFWLLAAQGFCLLICLFRAKQLLGKRSGKRGKLGVE